MILLSEIKKLNLFKVDIKNLLNVAKKEIKIKSYLRKGKLVKQSLRNIKIATKRSTELVSKKEIGKNKNKISNDIVKKIEKVSTENKKIKLNYFNTEYNNRLNVINKEEIRNWDKKLNNMNIKKVNQEDWDDSVSVLSFIQEDIKKRPESFRSISHEGKVMAMATVEEDKINKCLKVRNLLSNPDRLTELNMKPYGAGITSIVHMVEESMNLGYEGKLKLTALPKASKFYEKLGFKRIGSEYQFQYILEKEKAQELMDNHFSTMLSKKDNLSNFSNNEYQEAVELEKTIVSFAINKLNFN